MPSKSESHHHKHLYKPEKEVESQPEKVHRTFITPFVALSLLSLPSVVVLAYGKQTVAFDLLRLSGLYILVQATLWLLVPLALLSGVLYLIRGKNQTAKSVVAIVWVVLLASFVYVVWPQ